MKLFLSTIILLVLLTESAFAQSANPFVLDGNFSSIAGAEDISTVENILVEYEQQAIPQQLWTEDDRFSKFFGRLYRLGKSILLENVQDMLADLIQHEVFGHGARAREFGDEHSTYELHLFPPYGTGAGVTTWYLIPSQDQRTALSIGGIEAEGLLANELRMRALEKDSFNYRDANIYFVGRLALTTYALTTHDLYTGGGNDIAAYVSMVQYRNHRVSLQSIQRNSLLNFADPLTLAWVYEYLYRYIMLGDVETSVPMLHIENIRYVPGFRVALTPFGYDYYLENMIVKSNKVFMVSIGLGTADNGTSTVLKISTPNLWSNAFWNFGCAVDLWRQPTLNLSSFSLAPASTWNIGALAAANITYHVAPSFGLYFNGGYKTQGFVEGEELNAGPIIRAGVELK